MGYDRDQPGCAGTGGRETASETEAWPHIIYHFQDFEIFMCGRGSRASRDAPGDAHAGLKCWHRAAARRHRSSSFLHTLKHMKMSSHGDSDKVIPI
eukprot:s2461_g3.t6